MGRARPTTGALLFPPSPQVISGMILKSSPQFDGTQNLPPDNLQGWGKGYQNRAKDYMAGGSGFRRVSRVRRVRRTSYTVRVSRSFSAVSKPKSARKYALESSRRDLPKALLCTGLHRSLISKFSLQLAEGLVEVLKVRGRARPSSRTRSPHTLKLN